MSLSGVGTLKSLSEAGETSGLYTGNYLYVITVCGDGALHLVTDIDDESLCLSVESELVDPCLWLERRVVWILGTICNHCRWR